MRTPYRIPALEQKYGDLNEVIPSMVEDIGQAETAKRLEVSQGTVSRWLKQNGYRLVWIKRNSA